MWLMRHGPSAHPSSNQPRPEKQHQENKPGRQDETPVKIGVLLYEA